MSADPIHVNEKGAKQSAIPYRCDLLDDKAMLRLAGILHAGAVKYGDTNWRDISLQDHINHALTHIFKYQAGERGDEDHLGHALCRTLFAVVLEEFGKQ